MGTCARLAEYVEHGYPFGHLENALVISRCTLRILDYSTLIDLYALSAELVSFQMPLEPSWATSCWIHHTASVIHMPCWWQSHSRLSGNPQDLDEKSTYMTQIASRTQYVRLTQSMRRPIIKVWNTEWCGGCIRR